MGRNTQCDTRALIEKFLCSEETRAGPGGLEPGPEPRRPGRLLKKAKSATEAQGFEPSRTRTCDPLVKSQLLYQLSYRPTINRFGCEVNDSTEGVV